ncbi:MAG: DUF72 domain-containing protein [Bradyrhizobiaceae bacterium]|nr:DUF72 domain-containing protein [Bradyrhizobiaceae bacterium]
MPRSATPKSAAPISAKPKSGTGSSTHSGTKSRAKPGTKSAATKSATSKPATFTPAEPPAASITRTPVHVGIGGWTFEPWRGAFYPAGLPHAKELSYAASHLTSIEINGTFYRTQTPATFRKWGSEVPDGFLFSVKGPRYVTHRRDLKEARESIDRFLNSGVTELGDRLGPLLWQFPPTKKFDEADFANFLELLPRDFDGTPLRHVVEVRHASFCVPDFVALLRKFKTAVVFSEHKTYPAIADVTGDFLYLRLQKGDDSIATCYRDADIAAWADRVRGWLSGKEPSDLPRIEATTAKVKPRDIFVYFIHEGKVRAPAGAMALIEKLRS